MTEYAYKLVSLRARGQIDWPALERALKRGWEPVPLGEEPVPALNPLGMTPEQLANFTLHRMPKEKHDEQRIKRERLNAALFANTTHEIIALYRPRRDWPPIGYLLHRNIIGENEAGDPIWEDVFLTEDMLEGAKLAYEWLNARGLA